MRFFINIKQRNAFSAVCAPEVNGHTAAFTLTRVNIYRAAI